MFHGRTKAIWAALAALVLTNMAWANPAIEFIPGEYVVKLRSTVTTQSMNTYAVALGGQIEDVLTKDGNTVLLKRSLVENKSFALESVGSHPLVEYIEPNYIYRANRTPNDPKLNSLWGLINKGQKISGSQGVAGVDVDAERAWDIQTGSRDVVVAVIDTGVDHSHADISPNMWVNDSELNGEAGKDDDGNGYVDDVYGYDFANNDGDPLDDHGHGTHCSGTIGAKGDDGEGIVGVAWNVRIMGIKFLTKSGSGSLANAIKSIDYARINGANIMSNSWGGGGFSKALEEAIQKAEQAGILFVAAAGNSGSNNDTKPTYPASYEVDNVISVAAIDNKGQLASFSCYGKKSVHIAAPGVNILSSTPDGFKSWSGTSMATPHVSGVAALLLSNEPNMNYADIKARLLKSARPLTALRGKVATGMVNAFYALTDTEAPQDPNDPYYWDALKQTVESEHPYKGNTNQSWKISVEEAQKIALHFERFDTERSYDKVTVSDTSGNVLFQASGRRDDSFSPVFDTNTVIVTLTSDKSVNSYGFKIDAIHYQ